MVGPFQLPRAIIYIALSTYDELGAAVFITTISTLSGTTSACNGLGYLGCLAYTLCLRLLIHNNIQSGGGKSSQNWPSNRKAKPKVMSEPDVTGIFETFPGLQSWQIARSRKV